MKKLETFFKNTDIYLFKRLLAYVSPHKSKVCIILFCIFLKICFENVYLFFWSSFLASLLTKNFNTLLFNRLGVGIIWACDISVTSVYSYLMAYTKNSIIHTLKLDIYKHILQISPSECDHISMGEFTSRLHDEPANCINKLEEALNILASIIKFVIMSIILIHLSFILSFVSFFTIFILIFIYKFFSKKLRLYYKNISTAYDEYFSYTSQGIVGIKEIKSLNLQESVLMKFKKLTTSLYSKEVQIDSTNAFSNLVCGIINFIRIILIWLIGSYFVFINTLKIEALVIHNTCSMQFSDILSQLSSFNTSMQQLFNSLERIFNLMDGKLYKTESFGCNSIENTNGNISFENVSFNYGENNNTLDNVSFEVLPNTITAIVGKSGSGKSTIFNLLLKLYDLEKGNIYIDHISIQQFDEASLRKHISIISQQPCLFNCSIKENLKIVNPSANDHEIEYACKLAYIHDYILSLPDGYDTIINENSSNLSGGQKQRLAIARALLKNSKVILFDEATSALDNESQFYIKQSIKKLSQNHTILIIAHRLSTITNADQIIVLATGKVAGIGIHEDLLKNNSDYSELYYLEEKGESYFENTAFEKTQHCFI